MYLIFFLIASSAAFYLGPNANTSGSNYCYSQDVSPYFYYGSKTSYESVRGNLGGAQDLALECEPVKFWSLHRHGTRNPSISSIGKIDALSALRDQIFLNYKQGEITELCQEDIDGILNWQLDSDIYNFPNDLTVSGKIELQEIGRRFRNKHEALFNKSINKNNYYFRGTSEKRAIESAENFVLGAFGEVDAQQVVDDSLDDDYVIRPYSSCAKWTTEVDDSPTRKDEERKFQQMSVFLELVNEVSIRLGFKESLSSDDVLAIYEACRFQRAWHPDQPSAWCAAFTEPNFVVLEYVDDLGSFYKSGYGNDLHARLGCAPLQDMMNTFERAIDNHSYTPDVVGYFSHNSMIGMSYTALGLFNDEVMLTADNYEFMKERLWRSSKIRSFAANLAFVLYKCESGPSDRVVFYHNEMAVDYCQSGNNWCEWSTLKEKLSNIVQCDLSFCDE